MSMRAKKAADFLGVSSPTIRRWSQEGRIPFSLNAANQRVYDEKELIAFKNAQLGITPEEENEKIAFYVRSSNGDKASIDTQIRVLEQEFGVPVHVYSDKSSGLSDKRPGLNKMFKDAKNGDFNVVVSTHPDRLSRFGVEFVTKLLDEYRVKVEFSDTTIKSPNEELMSDFMALIASFSGKFYRLRGWEQQKKLLSKASEVISSSEKE